MKKNLNLTVIAFLLVFSFSCEDESVLELNTEPTLGQQKSVEQERTKAPSPVPEVSNIYCRMGGATMVAPERAIVLAGYGAYFYYVGVANTYNWSLFLVNPPGSATMSPTGSGTAVTFSPNFISAALAVVGTGGRVSTCRAQVYMSIR